MRSIIIEGTEFYIRNNERSVFDIAVIEEVFCGNIYKIGIFRDIHIVIDIGAHIGSFMKLAKKIWPDCKVVCIEPVPESAFLLQLNAQTETDVVVYQAAVRYDDKCVIVDGKKATGGGFVTHPALIDTIKENSNYFVADANVKLITLEEIVKENDIDKVDLIKFDCEGSEWDIILNMSGETASKIKNLVGEYHGNVGKFLEMMESRFPKHQFSVHGFSRIGNFWGYSR